MININPCCPVLQMAWKSFMCFNGRVGARARDGFGRNRGFSRRSTFTLGWSFAVPRKGLTFLAVYAVVVCIHVSSSICWCYAPVLSRYVRVQALMCKCQQGHRYSRHRKGCQYKMSTYQLTAQELKPPLIQTSVLLCTSRKALRTARWSAHERKEKLCRQWKPLPTLTKEKKATYVQVCTWHYCLLCLVWITKASSLAWLLRYQQINQSKRSTAALINLHMTLVMMERRPPARLLSPNIM